MILFAVFSLLSVYAAHGFFLDNNPCNLEPRYQGGIPNDPEFTTTIKVPRDCKNGTFRWDYPKGHSMVHFLNANRADTRICFGESIGGNIFTIVDLTGGANHTLPHVDRDDTERTVCTEVTTSADILLRIDAPSTMYYMGQVTYIVV